MGVLEYPKSIDDASITHRVHGTGIFTYIWLIPYMEHLGYTGCLKKGILILWYMK